jgi:hypothetical protein
MDLAGVPAHRIRVRRETAGSQIVWFGANGDRPIPNAFVP